MEEQISSAERDAERKRFQLEIKQEQDRVLEVQLFLDREQSEVRALRGTYFFWYFNTFLFVRTSRPISEWITQVGNACGNP